MAFPSRVGPQAVGHSCAESLEVAGGQVVHRPVRPESGDEQVGRFTVLGEHRRPQLVRVELVELGGQEMVASVRDGERVGIRARGPAGIQVVPLNLELLQRLFPDTALGERGEDAVHRPAPPAEVVNFAVDLLTPVAEGVGTEREVLVRLLGAVGGFPRTRSSSRLGHNVTCSPRG
jgi:hypothetical protein